LSDAATHLEGNGSVAEYFSPKHTTSDCINGLLRTICKIAQQGNDSFGYHVTNTFGQIAIRQKG